jgi:hypothetical protein
MEHCDHDEDRHGRPTLSAGRRFATLKVALALVIALTACALQAVPVGDDPNGSDPPDDDPPDVQPPSVVARWPLPGSTNVWIGDPILVEFDESVLASTLTGASVVLEADGGIPVGRAVDLSPDGKTLAVAPLARPPVPTSLTLRLTPAITDHAGNALVVPDDDHAWDLPAWQAPGGMGGHAFSHDAGVPSLALGPSGDAVVAWTDAAEQDLALRAARWSGGAWSPLGGAIAADPDNIVYVGEVAVADEGTPYAVWMENNDGFLEIRAARFDDGAWVMLGAPVNAGTSGGWEPRIALRSADAPVVAWEEGGTLYASVWDGADWQPFGGAIATGVVGLDLAMLDDQDPVILFMKFPEQEVHVSRWDAAEDAWAPLGGPLNAGPASGDSPARIAVDASGRPVVVWNEASGAVPVMSVARWDGAEWALLGAPLSAVVGSGARLPSIATSPDGSVVVVWLEGSGADSRLEVRRWTEGAGWADLHPHGPETTGATLNTAVSVATAAGADPIIAWQESVAGSTGVRVARWNGP